MMPPNPQLRRCAWSRECSAVWIAAASTVAMAWLSPGVAGGAEPPAAEAATSTGSYFLFLGVEVAIGPTETQLGLIRAVTRDHAEVELDGQPTRLPLSAIRHFRARRNLVFSTTSVTLSEPQANRVFMPNTDPILDVTRNQADHSSDNLDRLARAELAAANAASAALMIDDPGMAQQVQQEAQARADDNLSEARRAVSSAGRVDPIALERTAREGVGRGLFDACEISFDLSAPQPLADAFVVVLLQVLVPDNPKTPMTIPVVRRLPEIDASPKKVRVTQGNLPQGYGIHGHSVHIYAGGREVATNRSDKRMDLSRDDAFEYLLVNYLALHPRATQPVQIVRELVPPDFAAFVPAAQRERAVELTVDRAGRVQRVALEPGGAHDGDAYLEDVIRAIGFYPALRNGQPVDSATSIVLADLFP